MATDSGTRSFISDYSGPCVTIETLGKPSGSGGSKSPLEIWVVPITLALLASFGAIWTNHLVTETQKEISRRQIQAAQVEELAALTAIRRPPATAGPEGAGSDGGKGGEGAGTFARAAFEDYTLLATRLAGYGRPAIPVLGEMLCWDDVAQGDRLAVERSLLYVASQDGREAVGEAMRAVLADRVQLYPWWAHLSALRLLASLDYREAADTLRDYRPQERIADWESLQTNKEDCPRFKDAWERARELTAAPRVRGVVRAPIFSGAAFWAIERRASATETPPPEVTIECVG